MGYIKDGNKFIFDGKMQPLRKENIFGSARPGARHTTDFNNIFSFGCDQKQEKTEYRTNEFDSIFK